MRDVDAYPFAPELLGRVDRRTATAERIDHHVARVAAGPNDAFKQGYGLLRGVAEIFRLGSVQVFNIVPEISNGLPLHFIQIPLVTGNTSRLGLCDPPLIICRPHPLLCPPPDSRDTQDFIGKIGPVSIGIRQIR